MRKPPFVAFSMVYGDNTFEVRYAVIWSGGFLTAFWLSDGFRKPASKGAPEDGEKNSGCRWGFDWAASVLHAPWPDAGSVGCGGLPPGDQEGDAIAGSA